MLQAEARVNKGIPTNTAAVVPTLRLHYNSNSNPVLRADLKSFFFIHGHLRRNIYGGSPKVAFISKAVVNIRKIHLSRTTAQSLPAYLARCVD